MLKKAVKVQEAHSGRPSPKQEETEGRDRRKNHGGRGCVCLSTSPPGSTVLGHLCLSSGPPVCAVYWCLIASGQVCGLVALLWGCGCMCFGNRPFRISLKISEGFSSVLFSVCVEAVRAISSLPTCLTLYTRMADQWARQEKATGLFQ